ncbi:hypothetical protein GDO86_018063 [Hymenochirus boettgeri]|uniref:Uncharacterized protein n=1 Tax=Hymenochirus boettgeri TaxID=247094 RepID=A0A8T2IM40_9PIPI|nr:hypothetical protein GDO86_018063 [Hymenochirus boettgeri]
MTRRAQLAAITLTLESKVPRWFWPRLGIWGSKYGLGNRWYLSVRESESVQKVSPYQKSLNTDLQNITSKENPVILISAAADDQEGSKVANSQKKLSRGWQILAMSL